ncbi:stage V sporulation protein K [Cytobacillus firmus]|uniref:AAA family ATPase n=1 Tax=Cytobacillus firmus TaxID=1399 RepID=UPI00077C47C1|nr:AAA family ATPase [Cytobacillus firmus]MBG9543328.1 stage V sporulation protein K [Cytobacillus firmus]MBG9553900.1 stage V sporulation protein K [Cytobacillus firmus]MBG9558688.1 stage V sporulation protein K [Cytobacillus firmus]MBG9575764.1 stage V sporulation protein K [Cytobacillus firmus]MEC1893462.1 AAA family ATPase [Cytobacillus firmus]
MTQQNRQAKSEEIKAGHWKNELDQYGYIQNEAELLDVIKNINEKTDPGLLSELLAMAAISRLNKNTDDTLASAWLQKAVELDTGNTMAAAQLGKSEWKNKSNLLEALTFPPIRETDNRAAKKKTAEQFIEICRSFMNKADDELEDLQKKQHAYEDAEYRKLTEILEKAIEETAFLLKASEEYEQSISGVFHTSTYYTDMKSHLNAISRLKIEWKEIFESEEEESDVQTDPLIELNEMVGLHSVKSRVHDFYRFLKYQNERKSLGFQTKDELSLNMILTGNPGTGKTTIARLLAKIYHSLGVLPREEVIEADRSQLVGGFVGQTEENVRAAVEKAIGGVLFIDEAYSLKREGQTGSDYGQTAIDTLVSLMTGTEYGGKFAVIMAGYPEEMRQFLDSNPGLRSRFPESNFIALPDYSNMELLQIAEKLSADNDYVLTEGAKQELGKRIEKERVDDTFGNARTVRNIVLDAIFKKGSQAKSNENIMSYTLLEKEDFESEEEEKLMNPREQLDRLIGLETVKKEVQHLVSFVKMQQVRRERGLPVVPIQLHSVFTGNPGTGKTTVAKIYAELLKECGFLKRGHLIVASRADFVAGYVGQTAIKTKKKIREALGGVLFIDEAYSLLSQTSGDFGKEVIDTLVDEMTKHNENLVVVLAGYPNEMEKLMSSNPGLKSRFKKFFHFKDYSTPELLEIIISYAGKYEYTLTEEAKDYLNHTLSKIEVNGNGRFAANLADEAIQAQAMRIVSGLAEDIEQVSILEKPDFEIALNKISKGE